jgi:transposase-like protein
MKCIYCNHPQTYVLGDGLRKCTKCLRKFSPKKIAREQKLLSLFIDGVNAREASKLTGMHFLTIQKYYQKFRTTITLYSDTQYKLHAHNVDQYDEYLYLPKSLKEFDKNIHKLQHFLTLSYKNRVYNLMMPTIQHFQYQLQNEQDNKLLSKYLRFNKVAKLKTTENTITKFWKFFETFILQYKGVSDEQFIYYLKEAEWRFNCGRDEQKRTFT